MVMKTINVVEARSSLINREAKADVYTHFQVTDNSTGHRWVEAFDGQVPEFIAGPQEVADRGGLTLDQAHWLIGVWNRAQLNYLREFSYRLVTV